MLPIEQDVRFREAALQFDAGEYEAASELFEELFFEAVRDEVEFARLFLQLSVGMLHAERRQVRPAIERLREGSRAARDILNWRGVDGAELLRAVDEAIRRLETGERAIVIKLNLEDANRPPGAPR